jgi:hypothetical protein
VRYIAGCEASKYGHLQPYALESTASAGVSGSGIKGKAVCRQMRQVWTGKNGRESAQVELPVSDELSPHGNG